MTLDEWHAVLAAEPATPSQVGAVVGEFERLGFGRDDRAERLAVTAALLGLDGLGSTRDLVMGDAGRLLRMLRDCHDRAGLDALLPGHEPGPAAVSRPSLAAYWPLVIEAWRSLCPPRPGISGGAEQAVLGSDRDDPGHGAGL